VPAPPVGIEDDAAATIVGQTGWQRQAEFAPGRLLTLTLVKTDADLVHLGLAHDA
jgi:hypothetical protein